jgi:hypothetical protein
MNRSIALASVAFACLVSPAAAGVIGPTRPGQAIVLRSSGSGAICLPQGGGQEDLDMQVLPDGNIDPYMQPAGQAFVITGIDWGSAGGTAGEYTPVIIRLTSPHPPASLVFATGAVADVAGKTVGAAVVPDVAVAPGVTICVGPGAGTLTQVVVHGFHTTYK